MKETGNEESIFLNLRKWFIKFVFIKLRSIFSYKKCLTALEKIVMRKVEIHSS